MHASLTHFSIAVALATGIPLLAQTPSPSAEQPPTQKPTSPAAAQAGETMLTGCLRSNRADQGPAHSKGVVFTLEVTEATDAQLTEGGAEGHPARYDGLQATTADSAACAPCNQWALRNLRASTSSGRGSP